VGQSDPARRAGPVRRIPALDGVRGICMLAVLVGHLTIFGGTGLLFQPQLSNLLGGGEACLEVFFVLSGALITHLALSEIDKTGTLDLRAFRNRRVRRLAPAALLAILATTALSVAGLHDDAIPLGTRPTLVVLSVLAISSNWLLFSGANLGYLTPTWSLSVEEQFYLGWPLTLRRTWMRLGAAGSAIAALALLTAGLGMSVALTSHEVYTTYATPVAGVALLCGCLISIGLHSPWERPMRRLLGSTPLAVALAIGIGFTARWLHFHIHAALRGGYLLFEVETALFIGYLMVRNESPGLLSRALAFRPIVYLGTISYGAYLFHATIYQMWDRSGLLPNVRIRGIVDVTTALVVAGVSYRFFEEPIRRGQISLPRRAPRREGAGSPARDRLRFVPQVAFGLAAIVLVLQLSPSIPPLAERRAATHEVAAAGRGVASAGAHHSPPRDTPATTAVQHHVEKARPPASHDDALANLILKPPSTPRSDLIPVATSAVVNRAGKRWLAVLRPVASRTDDSARMTIYQWQSAGWVVVGAVGGIPAAKPDAVQRIGVTTLVGTADPAWVIRDNGLDPSATSVVCDLGGQWHVISLAKLQTDPTQSLSLVRRLSAQ
jgi:peptidoglycan/LPS O-acetylase OafA/YrhL